MSTNKNRVKGLKSDLFKKYQTAGSVANPSNEIQGKTLASSINDWNAKKKQDEENLLNYHLDRPITISPQWTDKDIAAYKKKNGTPMAIEAGNQSYGIPDIYDGQSNDNFYSQDQVLSQGEINSSVPSNIQDAAKANEGVAPMEKKGPSAFKTAIQNAWGGVKDDLKENWRDYVRVGVGLTSAGKGVYDDQASRNNFQQRVRNLNDNPKYMPNEYQYMGRPGSTSMIYAKDGAMIRRGSSTGAEEAELEKGEMFMLPNMDTYSVTGKTHAEGGEKFILPEGTVVFSNYLKVPGIGKTFAEEAKKYNITKYQDILDNPHSKAVDRQTAEIMHSRNSKKLGELFQMQQAMNGDSNGDTSQQAVAKYGMKYQVGGRELYKMSPEPSLEYSEDVPPTPYVQQPIATPPTQPSQVLSPEAKKVFDATHPGFVKQSPSVQHTDKIDKKTGLKMKADSDVESYHAAQQAAKAKQAAVANPVGEGNLGANPTPVQNTPSNIVGTEKGTTAVTGTVSDTNATSPTSMYWKTLPNGRKVWQEGQGVNKGKSYRDQYGGNIWNLVRNRLNENYDVLTPQLMSTYKFQLKDKSMAVSSPDQLIDIMEGGNNSLVAMRNFHKMIGNESGLFDLALDKGEFDNMAQAKTAQLFKDYVESDQYVADVASGKATTNIPWLKSQPVPIKNKEGKITGYKLEKAEIDPKYVQNYQAAYKTFGIVKGQQPKGKDMLKGFRIAPEGLADHQFMGLPISPVDSWGGNTTIGQVSAFEDEEPQKLQETPKDVTKTSAGHDYNNLLANGPQGKYTKAPFDLAQLTPEMYGMANSNPFPYATMDYNAPYIMPQTLNIQPQLQDVDNAYTAALSAGADPNSAFLSTLEAKQKMYSEKQNFDAQQRAQADQVNASSRWQEDIQDMQSLDKVYNYYTAQADDASTAQRQAIMDSASKKREVYNLEETRKAFWLNNMTHSYNTNGKTGEMTVAQVPGYDMLNIDPNQIPGYVESQRNLAKNKTK